MKEKRNIDELFRSGLSEHSEKAPIFAWDSISDELEQKKKVRFMRTMRYAAASAAIFISFYIGYEFADSNSIFNNKEQIAAELLPVQKETHQENTFESHKLAVNKIENLTKATKTETTHPEKEKIAASNNEQIIIKKTDLIASNNNNREEENISFFESLRSIIIDNNKTLELANPLKYHQNLAKSQTLFNSPLLAEASKNETHNNRKIRIGGSYAPVYSYRTSGNDFQLFNNSYESSNSSGNESGISTFSFGVNAQYALNNKWEFQSGIYYSQIGQSQNALTVKNGNSDKPSDFSLTTSAGEIESGKLPSGVVEIITYNNTIDQTVSDAANDNKSLDASLLQHFDYLEIPFLAKYKFLDKKIDLKLIGGVSTGFLIANETYFKMDGKKSSLGSTQDLNTMLYNSIFGIGIGYDITKRIAINVEPTFKYSLNSINTNSEYKYKPYSLGLHTGISINF
ncbi:MAG: outer membrane beta-barrel protein [Bacteroidota bacterium]|nr:outer membrane beta-barrel protein [Bacteroidota bacterium]